MAHLCHDCGRGAMVVNNRSKSMVATKSRQNVNLQPRFVDGLHVKLCTRCLRTRSMKPMMRNPHAPAPRLPERRSKRSAKK